MTLRLLPLVLLAGFLSAPLTAAEPEQIDVFTAGQDGYHTYRIPSVLVTPKGQLLAFCEGRKAGRGDSGDIDLVMKRSSDSGKTWSKLEVLFDDGTNTVGNPCPVVDAKTGTIWMGITKNLGTDTEKQINDGTSKGTRTVWMTKSSDDGKTWTPLVEITKTAKDPKWTWYATGPGIGVQLKSGRLVLPCDHRTATTVELHSHTLYSDDSGATWKIGGVLAKNTNECQCVELEDGSLQMNARSYDGKNRRAIATSKDGGLTWSPLKLDETLIEPVCQASLVRYSTKATGGKSRLLFSNPASTKREKMTVRLSYDEGTTWPVAKLLHEGPAAYSCLATLPDGTIGCLYERGAKGAYETITFARLSLEWLTDGKDKVK